MDMATYSMKRLVATLGAFTVLLGAVATLFVFVGSLVISLLEFVTAFVLVLVVITAPWVVINLLGHVLCRGDYHVHDLQIVNGGQITTSTRSVSPRSSR